MNELRIDTREGRKDFEPGDELNGTAVWKLDQQLRAIELRLFWFTRGKGTEDAGVVETVRFDRPMTEERRSFRFRLPEAPYSLSGKLISIVWALELVADPSKEVVRLEITVAPGGREVRLDSIETKKRDLSWSVG